jgi:hypothetical protein
MSQENWAQEWYLEAAVRPDSIDAAYSQVSEPATPTVSSFERSLDTR